MPTPTAGKLRRLLAAEHAQLVEVHELERSLSPLIGDR
jgi:hypothetical protein